MSHESKLNQELTDTELLPSIVLEFKGIKTNSQWDADGKCYFEVIGIGTAVGVNTTVSQSQYCLLYTSPSPRDRTRSRMPSSA